MSDLIETLHETSDAAPQSVESPAAETQRIIRSGTIWLAAAIMVGGLVTGIVGGATGSIDQLLAQVLATLGVGIGQADVWVTGVRCDRAVLVN